MAVVSCIARCTRDPSLLAATFATVFAFYSASALAQAPSGYYTTVDASNPGALRTTLHAAIDDHTRIPYTSTATDTWNVLELADEDPNDPNRILDVYKNASYAKVGAGNSNYDREHTWPKSFGFPNDVTSNYPYTDCHMLYLADASYNGSRSNRPFAEPGATATEYVTLVNNGFGGGSGVYPGNSNWGTGSFDEGSWEVWGHRRGDVARALLYMDIRYEGGSHGVTGHSEPNLILTDNRALISASNTGANLSVAYMGELSVLLSWHVDDPVDDRERYRNDVVYAFQGNRNPFIDHPEWVACLFDSNCGGGDIIPPAAPTGLAAVAGNGRVDLDWNDNAEADLAGYDVFRATASGGPFTKLNAVLVGASLYADTTVVNGTTYYYRVTAVDMSSNASAPSATVSATPTAPPASAVAWINEIHYDNTGTDKNEAVEIAGVAGTNLAGWRLIAYNGSGGADYSTKTLSGTIPSQQGGKGTVKVTFAGLQNGAPDGIALVNASNVVVEFLSYEGVFTATSGPAAGLTAAAITTSESESTASNHSLQRGGTGNGPEDFFWQAAKTSTFAKVNSGQTFVP
jgi:endonuclease I